MKITNQCKQCGKTYSHSLSRKSVFCSRKCFSEYKPTRINNIKFEDGGKHISLPVTQGKYTLIDRDDLAKVSNHAWYLGRDEARTTHIIDGLHTSISLQAFLLNPSKNQLVIHKNGNRLDNRRENLMLGNKTSVNIVRKLQQNNSTGYRGVSRYKKDGRWIANISYQSKRHFLGYYEKADDAARAYNYAAKYFFGNLAFQNDVSNDAPTFKSKPIWERFNIHKKIKLKRVTENGFVLHPKREKIKQRLSKKDAKSGDVFTTKNNES